MFKYKIMPKTIQPFPSKSSIYQKLNVFPENPLRNPNSSTVLQNEDIHNTVKKISAPKFIKNGSKYSLKSYFHSMKNF